jgi:hypothetical protein
MSSGSDTAGALLMILLGVAIIIRTAKGNLIPALRRSFKAAGVT